MLRAGPLSQITARISDANRHVRKLGDSNNPEVKELACAVGELTAALSLLISSLQRREPDYSRTNADALNRRIY